ncbi:hypothetical protein Vretimale_12474 [Volvox reticuliferus]|uniref:Uncharacterized protein n=1 Tax=Volvox reticuliferus TaxID=1737510 RepID=A0A8J4GJL0_9CHLO|nr:hypothetical protein Vretimale_12474 [Volvox reticuliferus]
MAPPPSRNDTPRCHSSTPSVLLNAAENPAKWPNPSQPLTDEAPHEAHFSSPSPLSTWFPFGGKGCPLSRTGLQRLTSNAHTPHLHTRAHTLAHLRRQSLLPHAATTPSLRRHRPNVLLKYRQKRKQQQPRNAGAGKHVSQHDEAQESSCRRRYIPKPKCLVLLELLV